MWGPDYLIQFALQCFRNIQAWDGALFACLLQWAAAAGTLPWGSGCSGTDSPHFTFEAIQLAMLVYGVSLGMDHVFSAEKELRKRSFIRGVACPAHLFGDVFHLSSERAWDHITAEYVCPRVLLQGTGCFIAGFVCKSVSALNIHKDVARTATSNSNTATGSTLWAALLYLQTCRPVSAIFENVIGLARGNQHRSVLQRLASLGYLGIVTVVSPTEFGFPQDRQRLYFMVVRADLVAAAGITAEVLKVFMQNLLHALKPGHARFHFDDALVPDDDPYVVRMLAAARQHFEASRNALKPRAPGVPAWVRRNCEQIATQAGAGSHWQGSLADQCPSYLALPDRCKAMLDRWGCAFPDERRAALQLSQSQMYGGEVWYTPTLTPGSVLWITHRGRLCFGRDSLRLQGLWIPDSVYDSLPDEISDTLLCDLAGNAFCTVSVLTAQLLVMTTVAKLSEMKAARFAATLPPSVSTASPESTQGRKRAGSLHETDSQDTDICLYVLSRRESRRSRLQRSQAP